MQASASSEEIIRHFAKYSVNLVLIQLADIRVLCAATLEEGVPCFSWGNGMLFCTIYTRKSRKSAKGKQSGGILEI